VRKQALRIGLAGVAVLALAGTLGLSGCSNLGYYWQSVSGHLQIMSAARPVDELVREPLTPERLRERLELAQRIRAFAVTALKLPDNASYRRYADLHRGAAIWNVTAAPPYSLELKTWCFPVTGCVGYRGYYHERDAQAEAARVASEGYETGVYPVPAYSTLGLMNWAGGDPLLNTFLGYPEGELAGLIFHELAHQLIYVKGDTTFNESFATSVERLGARQWLATRAGEPARREYAADEERRKLFQSLVRPARAQLDALYRQTGLTPRQKDEGKRRILAQFRADYARKKEAAGGDPLAWRGYDRWVREANNALFGAQAAYDELVPGFERLFHAEGGDWTRFYDAVRQLAALPEQERQLRLKEGPVG
jgi:predicted aminopeptidase